MAEYNNYVNDLMKNYPLDTDSISMESDDDIKQQFGGADADQDIPTGGFPPIYICQKKSPEDILTEKGEEINKREYSTHKTSVSIKDILTKRRKPEPFL